MNLTDILIPVIIACAFFGEAIFGFGGGLISVSLISLLIGVKDAATLVLVFQFCMGLLIWKSYKHIDQKSAKLMSPSAVIGTLAGTLLLARSSVVFLQLFLAVSILLFLVKNFWFRDFTLSKKSNVAAAAGAGFGGGLLSGLIGAGGPVVVMYLSVATPKKLVMRATFIYLFFIISLVRLGISIPEHLFTHNVLRFAFLAMPGFLIAIFIGQHVHQKVSATYYKLGINVILAGSAIVLLCKALL
jgi:uncharacterized membrane protein YfcA